MKIDTPTYIGNQAVGNTGVPVSVILSRFVVLTVLTLGIAIALIMGLRISQTVGQIQKQHFYDFSSVITSQITVDLTHHYEVLSDHASMPLVVQAVMQPEENSEKVADLMADTTFLGLQHQQVLLDILGNVVYQRYENPVFNYRPLPWFEKMISGRLDQHYSLNRDQNGSLLWRIVTPVYYRGGVEGVLVAEIPFEIIENDRWSENERINSSHYSLSIIHGGDEVYRKGAPKDGFEVHTIEPLTEIELLFQVDSETIKSSAVRLFLETIAVAVIVSVMMIFLSRMLGNHWFIRPIGHIQKLSNQLASGGVVSSEFSQNYVKELNELSSDFINMSGKVTDRENKLRKQALDLEQLNKELKDSQVKLVQSEKMASLGTMAAGVAHEINNPMGYIKNNTVMMKQYLDQLLPLIHDCVANAKRCRSNTPQSEQMIAQRIDPQELDFMLEDIVPLIDDVVEGVDRVSDIVLGLKSFARIDGGEQRPFNLNECIESTIKVVNNELKYKCELNLKLADLPEVYGNPGQINQVIMNFLVNAAQSIPDKGVITVMSGVARQMVFFSVADTGEGIAPENLSKLFTPFFTTKEIGKGVGLGLSVSHGIIEQHGGKVEVMSEPGVGTCFTVFLPAEDLKESSYDEEEVPDDEVPVT